MIRSIAVLLLVSSVLLADTIVSRDGTIYSGTVRGATDSTITILMNMQIITVPSADVIAIHFTHADAVYLLSGEVISGKVAAKEDNDVIIATPSGIRSIPGSSVDQVKYNYKSEMKVPGLPRTNRHFVNISAASSVYKEHSTSIFVALHISNHAPALSEWKNQFTGGTIQTQGFIAGLEAGYVANSNLMLAAGYEIFSTPTVEVRATSPTLDDFASYTFLYGSLLAGGRPSSTPELFIYGGADVGSLTGTEGIRNLNGLDMDATNSLPAYRLKAGARYWTSGSFVVISEAGYLQAKVRDLKLLGTTVPNFALDFSGLFYRFGVSFHILTTTNE